MSERLLVDRLAQSKWPSTPAPEGSDSTTLSVCNFYDGHSGLTTVLARTGFFVLYSVFKVR